MRKEDAKTEAVMNGWRPVSEISKAENGIYMVTDMSSYDERYYVTVKDGKVYEWVAYGDDDYTDADEYAIHSEKTTFFSGIAIDSADHDLSDLRRYFGELVVIAVPLPNGDFQNSYYLVQQNKQLLPWMLGDASTPQICWDEIGSFDPNRKVVFHEVVPVDGEMFPTKNMVKTDQQFMPDGNWKDISVMPEDNTKTFAVKVVTHHGGGELETRFVRIADGWVYEISTKSDVYNPYKDFISLGTDAFSYYFCEAILKQD